MLRSWCVSQVKHSLDPISCININRIHSHLHLFPQQSTDFPGPAPASGPDISRLVLQLGVETATQREEVDGEEVVVVLEDEVMCG